MRRSYAEITSVGADVVAIGTGDASYARDFIADEHVPFLVLVDDDARAAAAASVTKGGLLGVAGPATWRTVVKAWSQGHRQHRRGRRIAQLGATFVIGPGPQVHYQHYDSDAADHAPLEEVVAALPRP